MHAALGDVHRLPAASARTCAHTASTFAVVRGRVVAMRGTVYGRLSMSDFFSRGFSGRRRIPEVFDGGSRPASTSSMTSRC